MVKRNKKQLILTSVLTLLPILIGVVLWNRLPEEFPIHWNFQGEVDDWCGKTFAVFGIPVILLAIHWACILATAMDPKRKSGNEKVIQLVLWLIPIISLGMNCLVYTVALGREVNVNLILPVLVGIVFVVIGNYMPKCQQSYTIGIKLPWTLDDPENWNKTHRLAGPFWMVCGILMILGALTPYTHIVLLALAPVMVLVPTVYSYMLYRKKENNKGTD